MGSELTDYQRGYRAAQHRALSIMQQHRLVGIDNAIVIQKVELAQPAPPDPRTLTQSDRP